LQFTAAMVLVIQIILVLLLSQRTSTHSANIALPGCQDNCGGIPIPYPFGIGNNCSLSDGFNVTCDTIYTGSLHPLLYTNLFWITNISIPSGQGRFNMPIFHQCYNSTTKQELTDTYKGIDFSQSILWLNNEKNKFIVIGCNTLAGLTLDDMTDYSVGCISTCDSIDSLNEYGPSCSGVGCCRTAFPKATQTFNVEFDERYNHSEVYNFSRCSYAMVAEDAVFQFNTDYATSDKLYWNYVTVIFDWVIGDTTCQDSRNQSTYACKSDNSVCSDYKNGPGYICSCSQGYEGNPYLQGPGGCQGLNFSVYHNFFNAITIVLDS
jgi:Wall-associated receptor kinase galacturonan-binding/Wall-associated kinase